MNENQINNLRDILNSVIDELEKYYKPSETVLNCTDQLLEVNERFNSFNQRRDLGTRLTFNILFFSFVEIFLLMSLYCNLEKKLYKMVVNLL